MVRLENPSENHLKTLTEYGESLIVTPGDSCLKIHLHTKDRDSIRNSIESMGDVVQWAEERIQQTDSGLSALKKRQAIHIMTDAAGSVTGKDAQNLGVTLLDSYIVIGEKSVPETLLSGPELYRAMKNGSKVSTAQASLFERSQCYQSVLEQYDRVLYLCTGSVYTGNFEAACGWKKENDPENRMTVIDTGAASGRLGLTALAVARYSLQNHDFKGVIDFANSAVRRCEEYVFLDRLKYLAEGGRLSKTSGFFGDLLHMKPIISPLSQGAKKMGVVRNSREQLDFALKKMEGSLEKNSNHIIMLEYSDNRKWVEDRVKGAVMKRLPGSHIIMQPLSLTSGAHMGPGTWAIAFLPWDKNSVEALFI